MHPKLSLTINVDADIENVKYFVAHGEWVEKFLPSGLLYLTKKKIEPLKRNAILIEYTENYYLQHKTEIARGVNETKKRWKHIVKRFHKLVDTIFHSHPWPKGTYVGYASIFYMFPRNIKEQNFYFPYDRACFDPIATIAHEMLHFIFFDYIKRNFNLKETSILRGKNPKYVWQVSETFNTVIENWKPYMDMFHTRKKIDPYPGCKQIYESMSRDWKKYHDIDVLLKKRFE